MKNEIRVSTGPTSPTGKSISKMNATKYGLWAKADLLPGESATRYAKLVAGVYGEFAPVGVSEDEACAAIVRLLWRLRRVAKFESAATLLAGEVNGLEAARMALPSDESRRAKLSAEIIDGLSAIPRLSSLQKLIAAETHTSRMLDRAYSRLAQLQARRGQTTNVFIFAGQAGQAEFPKTNTPHRIEAGKAKHSRPRPQIDPTASED